jgi:hypothetical protein
VVGQRLRGRVEAALERTNYSRGEERFLYNLARPRSFLEGAAGDQQVSRLSVAGKLALLGNTGKILN